MRTLQVTLPKWDAGETCGFYKGDLIVIPIDGEWVVAVVKGAKDGDTIAAIGNERFRIKPYSGLVAYRRQMHDSVMDLVGRRFASPKAAQAALAPHRMVAKRK